MAINAEMLERGREDFMRGYVEAMLWANTFVERENEEGESEDVHYWYQTPGRWWEDTPVNVDDAETFWDAHCYVILSLDFGGRGNDWTNAELSGHDFALTRNGHGTGFWDRGLGDIGYMLSNSAAAYGTHTLILCVDENDDVLSAHNI